MLAALPCAGAMPVWGQAAEEFFPVAVWYGGGKARAPMLERDARRKKESWRKDVQQIKALGFNTLRAWIDWASGEPEEGAYHFETVDVLLELAEEEGLRLFLQIYMDSAPRWMGEKAPDSRFVSAGGEVIEPESSPGYCRDHPVVRAADTGFYRALASHVKGRKAFLGWDLWSEPHVINWANPTYIAKPEFCFCASTKARFREWLRKKYVDLDALNRAWYRRYTAWDQVEPNRLSTILSYRDYIDWKAFIVDKLGEDLRERYESVKRIAPETIVTSHAAGVGLFASPHYWEGQSDDWTMAAQVDFYGTSFYPKHSAFVDRSVPWRAALLDFTRSFGFDKGRRGFYIGELQGGFGTIALNVSPTVTPADLRVWTWSAISRGAKGINYYAWYPMSSGYESGGFGLTQLDGAITERAREAGKIGRVLDRNQRLFLAARPQRAEVAIVYNPLSHFVGGRQRAAVYGGPQGEVAGIERDSLLGVHHALFPLNTPVDYVHLGQVSASELNRYKLVVFPYPVMIPRSSAAVLRDYVERGGTLVAEARLGWSTETGDAAERIPGLGLWEIMGCREIAIQTGKEGRAVLKWSSTLLPGLRPGDLLPARWFEESLEPIGPDARVVAEFPDGAAAAVASTFGKGKTLMLGSYLSAAYVSAPSPETERLYRGLLQWAGVSHPVETSREGLEVRILEAGTARVVTVLNHSRAISPSTIAPATISLSGIPMPASATDLLAGRSVPLRGEDGRVTFDVQLAPDDVAVVQLGPFP